MTGSIARRYARAIFSLAQEEGTLEATGTELDRLADIAGDPELAAALANPLLAEATRKAVAATFAQQLALQPTTRSFVALLADRKRLDQLTHVAEAYRRILDRALGRVRARITTAIALTATQEQTLVGTFAQITGKTVLPTVRVDPTLLGGVVVEIEGKVYDGSLTTQLQRLAGQIAGGRSYL